MRRKLTEYTAGQLVNYWLANKRFNRAGSALLLAHSALLAAHKSPATIKRNLIAELADIVWELVRVGDLSKSACTAIGVALVRIGNKLIEAGK